MLHAHAVPATPDVTLKLTIRIYGKPYSLTVTPESFKLVPKGKRQGVELPWRAFVDEDAEMLSALHAAIKRSSSRG